jgi:hypothetical protein
VQHLIFRGALYSVAAALAIALVVILRLRARGSWTDSARQAAGPDGLRLEPPPVRRRPLVVGRQRRALWQAVSAADFAVLAAQQAGARTGDLDVLCTRLRLTVQNADRSMLSARPRLAPRTPPARVTSAIDDLVAAARLIQDAAAFAAASESQSAASVVDEASSQAEAIGALIVQAGQAFAGCPERETAGRVIGDCPRDPESSGSSDPEPTN